MDNFAPAENKKVNTIDGFPFFTNMRNHTSYNNNNKKKIFCPYFVRLKNYIGFFYTYC